MVEAVEDCLSLSAQPGQDEGRRRTHVGAGDSGAMQALDAPDPRCAATYGDVRTHLSQLVDMAEALLEDVFCDYARSFRRSQQRHRRGLQVGREARIGRSREIDADQAVLGAPGDHPMFGVAQVDSGSSVRRCGSTKQVDASVWQEQFAIGQGGGAGERAELDAVGQDGVNGAAQQRPSLDSMRPAA